MLYHLFKYIITAFAALFYRHKVYGKEHLLKGGGIIASNHCSFLDPPLIGSSCPNSIHYLARGSLYHFPAFGWLIRQLNTHPVHRGKGNLSSLKAAMELVQSGKKVLIFPEGSRSTDGTLHPGQLGIGMLVQKTQCRIFPVYIHGTYDAWNNRRKFPKLLGHTACVFGTPINFAKLPEDKKEAQTLIVETIMTEIAQLRDWYLAGAKGSPP
jgi:1-acyl-sn-glycerol-3-phosphate acyltransferase